MSLHAPPGYRCPFCLVVAGVENEHTYTLRSDVVLRDATVTAFVAAAWWPRNPGHVLIVPNAHHENLYELPDSFAIPLQRAARRIALAFKASYGCDGVSTRQHNEPAGNQDVWHFHLHIFPRYRDDRLYERHTERRRVEPTERRPYAELLRAWLAANPIDDEPDQPGSVL